jgi:hypothetical protein
MMPFKVPNSAEQFPCQQHDRYPENRYQYSFQQAFSEVDWGFHCSEKIVRQVNELIQPEHHKNDDKAYDLKKLQIAAELTMSDLNAHGHTPLSPQVYETFHKLSRCRRAEAGALEKTELDNNKGI